MNLKTGRYEQLIDRMLDGTRRVLPGDAFEIQREKVDESEGDLVLSRYLQKVISKAFRTLPADAEMLLVTLDRLNLPYHNYLDIQDCISYRRRVQKPSYESSQILCKIM
jgi:hypothetical protein